MKTANIWENKVGNNAQIANLVCLRKTLFEPYLIATNTITTIARRRKDPAPVDTPIIHLERPK